MKAAVVTVLAAAVCLAQRPFGPPGGGQQPTFQELKTYLTLTDSQVQGLQQVQQQMREAVQSILRDIQTKEQSLRDQVQKGGADPAALGRLLIDIETQRKRVSDQRTTFQGQALNQLTAAQKTKLKALEEAANLNDEIREATALMLLTPPDAPAGLAGPLGLAGPGLRGFPRPGGPGPRPGLGR